MRRWTILLGLLTALTAHASYFEDNCSDADGNVRWEEGHNDNQIFIKYWDEAAQEYKTKTFDVSDVKVKLTKKRTLLKKKTSGQCWFGESHKYAAYAVVTPTAEIKEEFKRITKKSSLKDYVICHDRWDSEAECAKP